MSTQDYVGDELSLFAQARNWKNYWSRKLEPFIEGSVLEVGAGIGSNLELLRKDQQPWVALEPDALQADQIRTHYTDTMRFHDWKKMVDSLYCHQHMTGYIVLSTKQWDTSDATTSAVSKHSLRSIHQHRLAPCFT